MGWPSLAGETSRSWAGRSPWPPPPQKTATLPALWSFQPTPLQAVNQQAFQGDRGLSALPVYTPTGPASKDVH